MERFDSWQSAFDWVKQNYPTTPISVRFDGPPVPGKMSFHPPQVDGYGRAIWEWA